MKTKIKVEKKGNTLVFPENIVDTEKIYKYADTNCFAFRTYEGDLIIAVFPKGHNTYGEFSCIAKIEGEYLVSCSHEDAEYELREMQECTAYNCGGYSTFQSNGMTWNNYLAKYPKMPIPVGIFLKHYERD